MDPHRLRFVCMPDGEIPTSIVQVNEAVKAEPQKVVLLYRSLLGGKGSCRASVAICRSSDAHA